MRHATRPIFALLLAYSLLFTAGVSAREHNRWPAGGGAPALAPTTTPAAASAPAGAQLIARSVVGTPVLAGDYVLWYEARGVASEPALLGYDLRSSQTFLIDESASHKTELASDGVIAAWVEQLAGTPRWRIQGYDLRARRAFSLLEAGEDGASFGGLALANGQLAYEARGTRQAGLYLRTLAGGQEQRISPTGQRPVLGGGALLWSEALPSADPLVPTWRLYLRALGSASPARLLAEITGQSGFSGYAVSARAVVWAAAPGADDTRIQLFDRRSETRVTISSLPALAPVIADNLVAWATGNISAAPNGQPPQWALQTYDLDRGTVATLVAPGGRELHAGVSASRRALIFSIASRSGAGVAELYRSDLSQRDMRFPDQIDGQTPNGITSINACTTPLSCGRVYKGTDGKLYDAGGVWMAKGVQFMIPQLPIGFKTFYDTNYNAAVADGTIDYWLNKAQTYLRANMLRIFVELPGSSTPTSVATVHDFAVRASNRGMRLGIVLHNGGSWTLSQAQKNWIQSLLSDFRTSNLLPLIAYLNADNEINNHCSRSSGWDCFKQDGSSSYDMAYVNQVVQWTYDFTTYVRSVDSAMLVTVGMSSETAPAGSTKVENFFVHDQNNRWLAGIVDYLSPHNYGGGGYGIINDLRNVQLYSGPVVLEEYGYPTDPKTRNATWTEGPSQCRTNPIEPRPSNNPTAGCANTAPYFIELNIRAIRDLYAGGAAWMIADVHDKDISDACTNSNKPFDLWTGVFSIGGIYCNGTAAANTGVGHPKATAYRVCVHHTDSTAQCDGAFARPQPKLDLVFVIDTTGSMSGAITAVQSNSIAIVKAIADSGADYRVGLVEFRDFPSAVSPDFPSRVDLSFFMYNSTANRSEIIGQINNLQASGGGDTPETVYSGLMAALGQPNPSFNWRKDAHRSIILIGDAAPHDPEPNTGYTLQTVLRAAAGNIDELVDINAILLSGGTPTVSGTSSQGSAQGQAVEQSSSKDSGASIQAIDAPTAFQQLAAGTGGTYYNAPTADDVAAQVLQAVNSAVQAPIADAGGSYIAAVGQAISFNASNSFDPDDAIVKYEWDFNNDGVYDLSTTSATTSRSYSAPYLGQAVLRVTDSAGHTRIDVAQVEVGSGFQTPQTQNTGYQPHGLALGDFNRDGKLDLVATNRDVNQVSVALGQGNGTFSAASFYNVGSNPRSVALGDFNRDGKLDIATANYNGNTVSVLLGNGSGSFGTASNYAAGSGPFGIAAGDLNRDGITDLAVGNWSGNAVSVLLGNSSGGFAAPTSYPAGTNPRGVAIGDLNRDGLLDVAVANNGSANISILVGNGSGGFGSAATYPVAGGVNAITLADANNDGALDLLAPTSSDMSVSVSLNNGSGNFGAPASYRVGNNPVTLAVGDINNDGKLDVVAANWYGYSVSVLPGKGGGAFSAAVTYAVGAQTNSPVLGDLNGDGKLDLAVANFGNASASILLGRGPGAGSGSFQTPQTQSVGYQPHGLVLGDFNRDSKLDLVAANRDMNQVSVALGQGTGTFGVATTYTVGSNPRSVALADFNRDGKLDIATANYNGNTVSVLLGNGSGGFGAASSYAAGSAPFGIAAGDLNRDGITDLAVGNWTGNAVSVLLGNSSGGFGTPTSYPVGTNPRGVAIGDLNRDGLPDLAVANNSSGTLSVLLGSSGGSFAAATNYATGGSPNAVSLADVNRDGALDLLAPNAGANTVAVLLGNGSGGFGAVSSYAVGNNPVTLDAGDANGDGKPDLVVANWYGSSVSVLTGTGNGSFNAAVTYAVGAQTTSPVLGDLNRDGKPDIIVANFGNASASILLNQ